MSAPGVSTVASLAVLGEPWASLDWSAPLPAGATLSWFSADNVSLTAVMADGSPVIAKIPRPHTSLLGRPASRVAALIAAGESGIAPRVLASDAETGIVVQELLVTGWRMGTLLRLTDPAAQRSYLDARSAFRELAVALEPRDVFDDLDILGAQMRSRELFLPIEATAVFDALDTMRAAVADGPVAVPTWGSGEISNVLVGDGGAVRLVGGELSGASDPLSDIGMILTELSPFVADDEEVFHRSWGSVHPGALARARLYGIADDVRAAWVSAIAHADDPTSPVEFLGYHSWRLRRAVFNVTASGQFDFWIANAAKGWK